MSNANKILEMIEEYDPTEDTCTLDEINDRVHCYANQREYTRGSVLTPFWERPTTSRDALKAIRPDGWDFNIYVDYTSDNHTLNMWQAKRYVGGDIPRVLVLVKTPNLPTEELAELHVIIQSIKWERENA